MSTRNPQVGDRRVIVYNPATRDELERFARIMNRRRTRLPNKHQGV